MISVLLLLLAALVDVKRVAFMSNRDAQLVATTIVVAVILFGDAICGLALGLALLVLYFRVYRDMLGLRIWSPASKPGLMDRSLVREYITEAHLDSAQNNIVDERDFATEIKGVKGVYGERVYGAQGLDTEMPGLGAHRLPKEPIPWK